MVSALRRVLRGATYAQHSELLSSDGLSSRSDGSKLWRDGFTEKGFKHTVFCCIATTYRNDESISLLMRTGEEAGLIAPVRGPACVVISCSSY